MPACCRPQAVPRQLACCRAVVEENRNVSLNLVLSAINGIADSIWNGTIIVAFLYKLTASSNTDVGVVEAMSGGTQLLTALPIGYIADKYSRSGIIKGGAGLMLGAIALTSFAVISAAQADDDATDKEGFDLLAAAQCLWGIVGGVIGGPAQALFADSIPTGERSRFYNYLFSTYLIGACAGPLLSVILFSVWGDDWDQFELRTVVLVGMALELPCALLMMGFRDDAALKAGGGVAGNALGDAGAGGSSSPTSSPKGSEFVEKGQHEDEKDVERRRARAAATNLNQSRFAQLTRRCGAKVKHIPFILFFADVIISLASGMTIKFFPLFFKDDCGFSPRGVQTVYVLAPLLIACFSTVGQRLSKRLGRIPTIVTVQTAGVGCLVAMILLYHFQAPPITIVVFYLVRTGLMNCTYPLRESILMDYVSQSTRARWKSLDSIATFGWCGSAALGGVLSDKYSYTYTFVLTAALQAMATAMVVPLWGIVANENEGNKDEAIDGDAEGNSREFKGGTSVAVAPSLHGDDDAAQPLITPTD